MTEAPSSRSALSGWRPAPAVEAVPFDGGLALLDSRGGEAFWINATGAALWRQWTEQGRQAPADFLPAPLAELAQAGLLVATKADPRSAPVAAQAPPPGVPAGWLAAPLPGGGRAWLSPRGDRGLVPSPTGGNWAQVVRWLVPYAAALRGLVPVHAAAFHSDEKLFLVVGASGAGKSTLARALAATGVPVLTDDLALCRPRGQGWVARTAGESRGHPVGGVFILERGPACDPPTRRTLAPVEALRALLRHGYGELAHPPLWRHLFRSYARLAETIPAEILRVPDDLRRLDEAVPLLQEPSRPTPGPAVHSGRETHHPASAGD